MVTTFLSLILATATADPVIPTLNPFLEISLPDPGQSPNSFNGPIPVIPRHVFIDDSTKSLLILHNPSGLSIYDLPTGKLRQTYTLARPHPFHVEYQESILTFFDEKTRKNPNNQTRTFNLKTEVEEREADKSKLPLGARLFANEPQFSYGLLQNVQTAHLYKSDRLIQIDQPDDNQYNNFTGRCDFVIRAYPSLKEISRTPVPNVDSLLDTYITHDRKTIVLQSPSHGAAILYSLPNYRKIGKFPASQGKLAFDYQTLWAISFGRNNGLSLIGEWPLLTNLTTQKQYRLDYENGSGYKPASSGAVSSKLGIAAIAGKYQTVHLYHLPN
jgi:hypothetical protein